MIPGNVFDVDNYTVTWVAYMYDGIMNYGDHPMIGESLYDTCQSFSPAKPFIFGPYQSTQEFSLHIANHPEYDYDYRLTLMDENWYVSLMEDYMDSVDCSRESLYMHIGDDALSITNTDGTRANTNIQSEILRKRRFSYQYWSNTASDTGTYPQGYVWIANGFCDTTREAAGYAFMRYLVQDSADYGDGNHRYTCVFADNQYRQGTAPRFPTYYTINSSSGGPTSGMDWLEIADIESNSDSLLKYYDESTLMIDSTITYYLDSICDHHSLQRVKLFVNTNKGSYTHNPITLQHASITWELSYEWPGASWSTWAQKDSIAHLVRTLPNRALVTEWRLNSHWDNGQWYTKDRMCYGAMAWFLTLQDTTIYASPVMWTEPSYWHECFQIDIGDPVADTTIKGDATGSGSTERRVIRRLYDNAGDGGIAVFRTGYGSDPGVTNDPITINLGDSYYKIDENRDTAITAVSSISILPMEGWIGVKGQASEKPPTISDIASDNNYKDSTSTISATIIDDYAADGGINHVYLWVIDPDDAGADSLFISEQGYSPTEDTVLYSDNYTFLDSGNYLIIFRADDDSSNVTYETLQVLVDIYHEYPVISNTSSPNGYTDSSVNFTATITDADTGLQYVYCYLFKPNDDSVHIGGDTLSPLDDSIDVSYGYTWPSTAGSYDLVFKAIDQDPSTTIDTLSVTVEVAGVAQDTIVLDYNTIIDAHSRYTLPDNNYGTSTILYTSQNYYHGFVCDYSMDDSLNDSWDIDSIWYIYEFELLGAYDPTDTTYLYLEMVEDNRNWTEDGLTWNNYTSIDAWNAPGGDYLGCISDTTIITSATHAEDTVDTITIHPNTAYGEMYLDSCKYLTGNFGFYLHNQPYGETANGDELLYLKSTEWAVESERPRIIIFPSTEAELTTASIIWQGIDIQGVDIQ
jgi:hypothetical protein